MACPRGRPLAEHEWREDTWFHAMTGMPFNEEVYKAGVLRRQAVCERRRYWDLSTGTRERRLLRDRREAAARPRKRRATQLTLDQAREGGITPTVFQHVLRARGHTAATSCGGDSLKNLHGHAQDPDA
jgi:hypothetical protein